MRFIGIDFSLTSTGVCEKFFDSEEIILHWFGATSHPKKRFKELESLINVKSFERLQIKDYNLKCQNDIIQASNLAGMILDSLNVKKGDIIGIEGFSMSSIGNSIFDLVQYQSILRYEISKITDSINFFAPAEIKKFFTGKGNAAKVQMIDEGLKCPKLNELNTVLQYAKPIDDLVDSYAIMRLLEERFK